MAKEKNLTAVTSVAAADFARVVTSAGASVKATFANVAKYIIETYNGSTVAGSAQSVKSALDSLNSKISQFYTFSIAMGNSNNVDINFSEDNGLFLLLCMDRRSGATPKACLFQKYSGSTNKYALAGGSNWASTSTSTGMRVTLENTYYTVLAIGNVPFTMTAG